MRNKTAQKVELDKLYERETELKRQIAGLQEENKTVRSRIIEMVCDIQEQERQDFGFKDAPQPEKMK